LLVKLKQITKVQELFKKKNY